MSKEVFKNRILNKIENLELKRRLELFYLSNLIVAKISKIEHLGLSQTIDIETKNHNFIANGLIVHNSSQRYHRVTEGLAKEFFRRVAESMKEIFFDMPKLKGILIGGPIPTKEDFLDEGQLVTKLKEKVIAVKDVGYVDEHGLNLLVEASYEDISEQEKVREKKIIQKFFETLGKHKEKAVYGMEKTTLALQRGAVEVLLISKDLPKKQIQEFEKMAENIGAEVHIISTENEDGLQFLNLTKGVGAILRFQIE
jgi:peptide chain release factor subunit 1